MKQSFILGGFLGFTFCFASALLAGSDADGALRDAVFCALITALLFRWLHGAMFNQLSATQREREQAAANEAAASGADAPAAGQPGLASA